jgi:hypothetical protein
LTSAASSICRRGGFKSGAKKSKNLNQVLRKPNESGAPFSTHLRTPGLAVSTRRDRPFEQIFAALDPDLMVTTSITIMDGQAGGLAESLEAAKAEWRKAFEQPYKAPI